MPGACPALRDTRLGNSCPDGVGHLSWQTAGTGGTMTLQVAPTRDRGGFPWRRGWV